MTVDLSSVTRSDVLQTLAEHDEMGQEEFLETYLLKATGTHELVHEDKAYDAHAVLGVAHWHAVDVVVQRDEIPGGTDGAVEVLGALGFEVRTAAPEAREAGEVGHVGARAAWAEAARPVLVEAAGRYRATITQKKLSNAVQKSTGITTAQPMAQWLGDVLDRVAEDCASRGEPLLSSLCTTVQGSVGAAYAGTVERLRGTYPEDPDDHAATERLECYRHWEAVGLPSDGGTPLRTAHFAPAKRAATKRAPARVPGTKMTPAPRPTKAAAAAKAAEPAPKPIQLCPRCFTAVPSTGICDYCD